MIGGSRVSSRVYEPMKPHVVHARVSDENLMIAELVPFWPETISTYKIARIMGMTPSKVMCRLSTVQDRYMIFGDGLSVSRLRDDLSNLDVEE